MGWGGENWLFGSWLGKWIIVQEIYFISGFDASIIVLHEELSNLMNFI
jgi:hypothetical protein